MKLFLKIILLLFVMQEAKAQTNFCGVTSNGVDQLALIPAANRMLGASSYTVRIFAHFIREPGFPGNLSGMKDFEFAAALQLLSTDLAPHNICISLLGSDEIFDNAMYNYPGDALGASFTAFTLNRHTNAIDVYFYPATAFGVNQSNGQAEGPTPGLGSAIVIGGTWTNQNQNIPAYTSHLFSHEIAHCFGLWHTHTSNISCIDCGTLPNCLNCGDFCCDTDPEIPINSYTVNLSTCEWNTPVYNNSCSNFYSPNYSNIMSYSEPVCLTYFTIDQGQRMRNTIANSALLQKMIVPDNVFVQNITNTSRVVLYATKNSITAGNDVIQPQITTGDVNFEQDANGEFKAHEYVVMKPGFKAAPNSNGSFWAHIDPNFCSVFTDNGARTGQLTSYYPLFNNSKWLSTNYSVEGFTAVTSEVVRDTLINNLIYHWVRQSIIKLSNIINNPSDMDGFVLSENLFREDVIQKKIYSAWPIGGEYLQFDFSLTIGSHHPIDSSFILTTIDSVNIYAGYRNRLTFSKGNLQCVWIEGVGNVSRPLESISDNNSPNVKLLCLNQNNTLVYNANLWGTDCAIVSVKENTASEIDFSIVPNPTSSVSKIYFTNFISRAAFQLQIFDSYGKLIESRQLKEVREIELNLQNYKSGTYILKLHNQDWVLIKKLCVIK